MKIQIQQTNSKNRLIAFGIALLAFISQGYAQDTTVSKQSASMEQVKNTFYGNMIINNQTVMVPDSKTFEFNILHRFGVIEGYNNFYGLFTAANINFGFNYTPINNLQLGIGITQFNLQWDGNIKYALIKQSVKKGYPLSITYYGDMAVSTLPKQGNFVNTGDRVSYFNQLMFARKVTRKLSLQFTTSLSYFDNVPGYIALDGSIQPEMKNAQFAIGGIGSYMVTNIMSIIADYNQPITQNTTNNPHPDLALGLQIATATHNFQIFVCNYQDILQQDNNLYNQNDYTKKQFLIGFNISKRWNYK